MCHICDPGYPVDDYATEIAEPLHQFIHAAERFTVWAVPPAGLNSVATLADMRSVSVAEIIDATAHLVAAHNQLVDPQWKAA